MKNIPPNLLEKQHRQVLRVQAMGKDFGVDLDRLARAKVLPPDLRETLSVRCMGCLHPEACDAWLAKNKAGEITEVAPHFCRNTDVMRGIFATHAARPPEVGAQPFASDETALEQLIHAICAKAA